MVRDKVTEKNERGKGIDLFQKKTSKGLITMLKITNNKEVIELFDMEHGNEIKSYIRRNNVTTVEDLEPFIYGLIGKLDDGLEDLELPTIEYHVVLRFIRELEYLSYEIAEYYTDEISEQIEIKESEPLNSETTGMDNSKFI